MRTKLELYIFIDALGFELTERYGFLKSLLPERFRVRTQFGYSAGAVPTILSGKRPDEHGHFSFFRYDPEHSPFRRLRRWPTALLPEAIFGRHRVRNVLSRIFKKILGYTGYFQLYAVPLAHLWALDYSEKRDMFVPGGLAPVRNLADLWQERAAHISDWRKSSDFNFDEMSRLIADEAVECGFLYSAAFDGFLHQRVGDGAAVQAELARYEARITALYELARQHYRTVTLTVFSDHGMTPLAGTTDLRSVLKPWRWGRDYASVLDSTMARFWWLKPEAEAAVRAAVQATGHGRWLTAAEKEDFGVAFADHAYGDDIWLLEPGWQICPSDMGGKPLPGMHGYTPADKDSDACFLSNQAPPVTPDWIGDYFRIMSYKSQGEMES